jgi:hypothetical protein
MSQLQLALIGRLDAPSVVPYVYVAKIKTYTGAVIACWLHRRVQGMNKSSLANAAGMRPSHMTDYLNPNRIDRKGHELRDMPAKYIPAFEAVNGNTFVSQWLAMQSKLIVVESLTPAAEAA